MNNNRINQSVLSASALISSLVGAGILWWMMERARSNVHHLNRMAMDTWRDSGDLAGILEYASHKTADPDLFWIGIVPLLVLAFIAASILASTISQKPEH